MSDPFDFPDSPSVNPARLLIYLYLSSYGPSCDQEIMHSLGITHILNLSNIPNSEIFPFITYKALAIQDDPSVDIMTTVSESFEFIEVAVQGNGIVLVHCQAGISRSASIVIAYLMKKFNMNMHEGFSYVKAKRPCVAPNPGFIQQLCQLELVLGKEASFSVVDHLTDEILQVLPHVDRETVRNLVVENDCDMVNILNYLDKF